MTLDARSVIRPKVTEIITIDFETYYAPDYTLSKLTTSTYIRDPRFQVIGVGVIRQNGFRQWFEAAEFREWVKTVHWDLVAVLCHHAHFDGLILAEHFGVIPAFWFDTLSMANGLGLSATAGGSLAKLMHHFQVGEKGTEVLNAIGKRREHFTREEWLRYGDYCLNDCDGTWAIFTKMEPHFPAIEAANVDLTVRAFTEPIVEMDTALLSQALADEQKKKADLLERCERDKEQLMSNDKFAVLLMEAGEDPPRKISPATGKETWAFAKSEPGMKELLESPIDEVRWLVEARVGVKSTIAESRIGRMLKLVEGGRRAPVYLRYAAAHTQRWGGGDKTNFQNLPRKGALKNSMMAPPGYVFVAADSGAIEARGLAWIAGQSDLVKLWTDDRKADVYSKFASTAYGRHVDRKKNPEDEVPGFVGKICVLGLGYGLGWKKLSAFFLQGAMGGPPVRFGIEDARRMGIDVDAFKAGHGDAVRGIPSRLGFEDMAIHCAVSHHLVKTYRNTNTAIREFWRRCDELLDTMLERGSERFGPGGAFVVQGHSIKRPSGLSLHYPGLQVEDDGVSYLGNSYSKKRAKLYGGLLTENLVQSFCRDIIAEQAAFIRWYFGYKIVTLTHDETVMCVPEAEGPAALMNLLGVMKTSPAWCADLPLYAEGGVAKRYGECKK